MSAHRYAALALALLLGGACREAKPKETDEAKLIRLRAEVFAACDTVATLDSVDNARAEASARINARAQYGNGSSTMQEMINDRDEVLRKRDEYRRLEMMDSAQLRAYALWQVTTRTKCDLAQRALSLFMAGR